MHLYVVVIRRQVRKREKRETRGGLAPIFICRAIVV